MVGEAALMGGVATLMGSLTACVLGWSLNRSMPAAFLPEPTLLVAIPAAAVALSVVAALGPARRSPAGEVNCACPA